MTQDARVPGPPPVDPNINETSSVEAACTSTIGPPDSSLEPEAPTSEMLPPPATIHSSDADVADSSEELDVGPPPPDFDETVGPIEEPTDDMIPPSME